MRVEQGAAGNVQLSAAVECVLPSTYSVRTLVLSAEEEEEEDGGGCRRMAIKMKKKEKEEGQHSLQRCARSSAIITAVLPPVAKSGGHTQPRSLHVQ